jgi:hypothetical protein
MVVRAEQEVWPIMADNGRRKGNAALLMALAAGQTIRDAASTAAIGERPATRRIADPKFRRQVTELRADIVQRALGKLADVATQAVDTLRGLLVAVTGSALLSGDRVTHRIHCRVRVSPLPG